MKLEELLFEIQKKKAPEHSRKIYKKLEAEAQQKPKGRRRTGGEVTENKGTKDLDSNGNLW